MLTLTKGVAFGYGEVALQATRLAKRLVGKLRLILSFPSLCFLSLVLRVSASSAFKKS